jgi:hypothetical protein
VDVDISTLNNSHQLSEATQQLVESLNGIQSAAIQIGSLLLIKRTEDNKPVVSVHFLSREQIDVLEQKPDMLKEPSAVLEFLKVNASSE